MIVKNLGLVPYLPTCEAMTAWTHARVAVDAQPLEDEIWICQHPPVYTQGLAGRPEHVLLNPPGPNHIPVVQTNRGGQVTYHGPGQLVAYPLLDLKRLNIYVKEYVYRLEQALLKTLEHFGVTGHRIAGAPGIYVRLDDPFSHAALPKPSAGSDPFAGLGKVAALGIKVERNCTYHGLALNVEMDLAPYQRINPCGYAGLRSVDLASLGLRVTWEEAADVLGRKLSVWLSP